jgi:CNT family concentrative nucleoside transporter
VDNKTQYILDQTSFSLVSIGRGMLGLIILLSILYFISNKKSAVKFALIGKALLLQILLAIAVIKVPLIEKIFEAASSFFVQVLNFSSQGAQFIFGGLVARVDSFGFIFAFQVLPTIVFFSALTALLFYLGIIQKVVYIFAWVMKKTLKLSGAESLAASANIFLGQTESPLLIKPYLKNMTDSEILTLMTAGMATIAGGVLAAYVGFLGGTDPVQQLLFAKHLLTASVMAAPAAVVTSKLLMPETEIFDEEMTVSKEKLGANVLEAIAIGTTDGIKLAVNVGAMLIVFIAFIAMLNYVLQNMIGEYTGLNTFISKSTGNQYSGLSMQYLLGILFKPLAFVLGVEWKDASLVGQLIGEKSILNEFVAYTSLGTLKANGAFVSSKSLIMATYMLCGFANFASIGIQIGGIGALAPEKRPTLSKLGIRALIAGTSASLITATIVGMFYV